MTPAPAFRAQAAVLVTFLATCAAVFLALWRFAGGDVDPFDDPYRVQAVVPSAVALATHADVRQAGVRIGKVARIADRGTTAVLELEIDGDHRPVYRDARVLVRTKTLSGENYVALDPGAPAAGTVPHGGALTLANAGQAVQLDEVLSTLDRQRRRALQQVLDGLGGALRGRGGADLNRTVAGTADLLREGRTVTQTLATDREAVAGLVDDVGRLMRAIGQRGDDVRMLARRGRLLAGAVAARDDDLRTTLRALPGFLAQVRRTTPALGAFSSAATPVVGDLADATRELVPAVRQLEPAVVRTRRAVRALDGFARRAMPLARRLGPFARAAVRIARPLEGVLRDVNPLLAHLVPYAREVGSFMSTQRAQNEVVDALGHYARVIPLVSKSNLFGLLTPEQEAAYQALVRSGVLQVLDTRGRNAYPAPGTAFEPKPTDGSYERVRRDAPYTGRP